ncbi:hypothetical protein Poli38472_004893 [Pythium oligandrum]|uniref:Uncharacterized protein n=1 Tax=Pythium oligandrum TaxID=41045 RepID=A0A8K1CB58_PYTOL|nr:hypothetical protein Poli38472_004893 [Pythium oligandrum]|eukprot:TMW59824.1 hypothetical protein Poli38472_004893 [Pythium oligandrum]
MAEDGDDVLDATLHAALAFVDQFYEQQDMSIDLDVAGYHPDKDLNHYSPREDTVRRRRHRKRTKEQLGELRARADVLERVLNSMKSAQYGDDDVMQSENETRENIDHHPEWEEISKRQEEERKQSTIDNVKLRDVMDDQLKLARTYDGIIRKRPNPEEFMPFHIRDKRQRTMEGSKWLNSPELKEDLLQTVGQMFTELNGVFADPRFDSNANAGRFRIVGSRCDEGIVESLDSCMLPFDYMDTADAVWNVIQSNRETRIWNVREKLEQKETVTTEILDGVLESPLKNGAFHGKLVCRQIIEADRVVILCAMAIDMDEVQGDIVRNMHVRSRAWHVIRPARVNTSGKCTAAVWQAVHLIGPDRRGEDKVASCHQRLCPLVRNHMIAGITAMLEGRNQLVENRLLDSMLMRRC